MLKNVQAYNLKAGDKLPSPTYNRPYRVISKIKHYFGRGKNKGLMMVKCTYRGGGYEVHAAHKWLAVGEGDEIRVGKARNRTISR